MLRPREAGGAGEPRRRGAAPGLVVVFAAALCALYLGSTSKWWYEDDPTQFAAAARIRNPADIFLDPAVLRGWGTGASLVPMHVLSYWLDVRVFGVSPRAARIHNLVSTAAVCGLLFLALAQFGAGRARSAVAAGLWLTLPATVAAHEFLGTRHYLEGLGASLAACIFLHRVCRSPPGTSRFRDRALLVLTALAAILFKEIYAAALLTFVFLYALSKRRFGICALAVGLAAGYAAYRFVMLSGTAYPHPAWNPDDYLRYLRVLPFTFSASEWGVAFYAVLAGAGTRALLRGPAGARRFTGLMLAVFAAGLLASSPTAQAVRMTYQTPGTWYRAVFILHTIAFLAAAFAVGRSAGRRLPVAALCGFLALVLPGTERARRYWNDRFAASEAEGRFYLAHPGRLVYSEEDATWFLPGLERLYGVEATHFVSKNEPAGDHARAMVERFPTIWRRRGQEWVEDPALFALLRERTATAP